MGLATAIRQAVRLGESWPVSSSSGSFGVVLARLARAQRKEVEKAGIIFSIIGDGAKDERSRVVATAGNERIEQHAGKQLAPLISTHASGC